MPVILGPITSADIESLELDGLELNDHPFAINDLDLTPPPKTFEWAKSADQHGATLVRPPFHELRQIKVSLRVRQQADMDTALDHLGSLVDKVQSAERVAAGGLSRGLELIYVPVGSTYSFSFYVQAAEIVGTPIDFHRRVLRGPFVEVVFWCDPFGYDAEVSSSVTSSALPVAVHSVSNVEGDVPAEARLVVTDTASQARDHVEFGVESRANSWDFLIDSDSLVTAGFAGTQTTRTGAYDVGGGNTVVRGTVSALPVAICSTAELTHVGTYRIRARVYVAATFATDVSIRLAWRQGRDAWTENRWQNAGDVLQWYELDLGIVTLREALLGTQTWQGRIEAKGEGTTSPMTVDVDYVEIIPADYGKATALLPNESPVAFVAQDGFDQSAGALAGKTLPVGGTWAGAGDADDFSVETTGRTAQRTAVSDAAGGVVSGRIGLAGVTTFTNQAVQVDVKASFWGPSQHMGVVARYTSTSQFVAAGMNSNGTLYIELVEGGVATTLVETNLTALRVSTFYTIKILVTSTGTVCAWWYPTGTPLGVPQLVGSDSRLATGGTLASGRAGMIDYRQNASASTRNFDNFAAWVPEVDHAINSGQSLEFRAHGDPCIREDSTGAYWGRPGEFNGARFHLPVGDSRVAVKARRTNVNILPDEAVTDGLNVQTIHRARHIVIPRS